jgi:DMSO/TMAO reductase YedYZ heme-binding membrane subunit
MNEQLWWYVARSGGIVALTLTGLSVIWGLLYSAKLMQGGRPGPRWTLEVHRFLGAASVAFTGIHVLGLVMDSYVHFGWAEVLLPFASQWQPGAVAWGVVTMYLLAAVELTSLFMRRIPRRWWKGIHLSSYALFWTGLVHGVTAGTDAPNPLYIAGSAIAVVSVLGLTTYRILTQRKLRTRPVPSAARPSDPTPMPTLTNAGSTGS